jgi:acetyl-CoA acetyltransferase
MNRKEKEIVLAGGMRTPFGDFGRSLKDVPLTQLSIHAAKSCLNKAGLSPEAVDHLVFGNCLPVDPDGLFSSRVIALGAGMPVESSALNVSRACGSGAQAIITAGDHHRSRADPERAFTYRPSGWRRELLA